MVICKLSCDATAEIQLRAAHWISRNEARRNGRSVPKVRESRYDDVPAAVSRSEYLENQQSQLKLIPPSM